MAEFTESQGVKTYRDNEFKQKLVDGQSGVAATKTLSVDQDQETLVAGTNDWGLLHLGKRTDGKAGIPALDNNNVTKVTVVDASGLVPVTDPKTHSAVAVAASDNHLKVITNLKSVNAIRITVASIGLFKWAIGYSANGTTMGTTWKTVITSPARPTAQIDVNAEPTGDGTAAILVTATNKDLVNANDAWSTIEFTEK